MIVNVLLEGYLEEAVAKQLLVYCKHSIGTVYGKKGADFIRLNAYKFHNATVAIPLFILSDFIDSGYECPPEARYRYLGPYRDHPSENFVLRFAVNELEAWLLSDRANFAKFLGVPKNKITPAPETLADAKQEVINLARKSRKQKILQSIVPLHGGKVGPEY